VARPCTEATFKLQQAASEGAALQSLNTNILGELKSARGEGAKLQARNAAAAAELKSARFATKAAGAAADAANDKYETVAQEMLTTGEQNAKLFALNKRLIVEMKAARAASTVSETKHAELESAKAAAEANVVEQTAIAAALKAGVDVKQKQLQAGRGRHRTAPSRHSSRRQPSFIELNANATL